MQVGKLLTANFTHWPEKNLTNNPNKQNKKGQKPPKSQQTAFLKNTTVFLMVINKERNPLLPLFLSFLHLLREEY